MRYMTSLIFIIFSFIPMVILQEYKHTNLDIQAIQEQQSDTRQGNLSSSRVRKKRGSLDPITGPLDIQAIQEQQSDTGQGNFSSSRVRKKRGSLDPIIGPLDIQAIQEQHSDTGQGNLSSSRVRKKRGSLDPIIGPHVRKWLRLKKIDDEITTQDATKGFRTTIWPLKHRPVPYKITSLWCLSKILFWPLLCLCCLGLCCIALCVGTCFRRANCLDEDLGFIRTCCLMSCCFCCPTWIASKVFPSHVSYDDRPCCGLPKLAPRSVRCTQCPSMNKSSCTVNMDIPPEGCYR